MALVDVVVNRERLMQKLTCGQRPERSDGAIQVDTWDISFQTEIASIKDSKLGTFQDRVEGDKVGKEGRLHHAGLVGYGRNLRFCSKYDQEPLVGWDWEVEQ